jgi:4-diphosphocytidyl-2-C-methyl-D-erythritol kinase
MLVFPNAKINIGLHIVEKRNDGYHNIESIFYPIPLQDALEAVVEPLQNDAVTEQSGSISLVTTGFEILGNSSDNLITKAYHLLQKDYPQLQGLRVHLHKAIPMGAGLGGGSADCAFFIRLLNQLYALELTPVQLHNYAQKLGSDCAFFIVNTPAYATQRGEVLMPIALNLSGYYLVLVKPNIHVSTAEAYAGITPKPSLVPLTTLIQQPVEQWKDSISNDFEAAIFATYPVLNEIKTQLYTQGAVYSAMSGSGATVYGLFKNEVDLEQLFAPHFYYATTL